MKAYLKNSDYVKHRNSPCNSLVSYKKKLTKGYHRKKPVLAKLTVHFTLESTHKGDWRASKATLSGVQIQATVWYTTTLYLQYIMRMDGIIRAIIVAHATYT